MENSFKKNMPWRINIIITLVFILLPTSFNVYANQSVFISEVNFAGSTRPDCKLCSYDKWIELFNPSHQAIDVSFWTLRFRESQDAANNLKFPPNTFIQAKSNYLVRNRYNGLTSTLSSANIQADAISGKVLRVSSNTPGQRRIQASLLNSTGQKISEFNLNEIAISKLENETNFPTDNKFSIEFNPDNSDYKISEKAYFASNYGSPKFGSGSMIDIDKIPEVELQPVASSIINLKPESPNINIANAEIKVEVNSSAAEKIPAQAPAQQPTNIVSEVGPEITNQVTSLNIPQVIPQNTLDITIKPTPQNISNPAVLQNPQVAPLANPEVIPQPTPQVFPLTTSKDAAQITPNTTSKAASQITSQSIYNDTLENILPVNFKIQEDIPTMTLNHKLKLSEINITHSDFARISVDQKSESIEQITKPFYPNQEYKNNINLWPLVLLMLASIAYKKTKNYSKSLSFVNVLTKNLSIASN
jgi:hypothetical protein